MTSSSFSKTGLDTAGLLSRKLNQGFMSANNVTGISAFVAAGVIIAGICMFNNRYFFLLDYDETAISAVNTRGKSLSGKGDAAVYLKKYLGVLNPLLIRGDKLIGAVFGVIHDTVNNIFGHKNHLLTNLIQ